MSWLQSVRGDEADLITYQQTFVMIAVNRSQAEPRVRRVFAHIALGYAFLSF